MRALLCLVLAASIIGPAAAAPAAPEWRVTYSERPRVVVTTDGEIDDRCSMVRFLLYTNEWETCGLIFSSSMFHWKGTASVQGHDWQGEEWLRRQLDAYASVYPNLRKHDPRYPSPDSLRQQVFEGNVGATGDMEHPTPGSDRIVELLLDSSLAPVWLQAWGGPNTIARALRTIEEQHPERKAEVSRKAVLYLIMEQDQTYRDYIRPHWADLPVIISQAFPAIAYDWRRLMEPELHRFFDGEWMRRNILEDHGPLCARYEANEDGSFRSEGDSPAFLHMLAGGLGAREDPGNGGWGGRFAWDGGHWASASDGRDPYAPILRWAPTFQNDWAARADWCVRPVDQCNHAPKVVCGGDRTARVVHRTVVPGAKVHLSAAGTTDPDGDHLAYRWWVYKDAGSFWGDVPLRSSASPDAEVAVPVQASGRTIHVILEVRDSGDPPLTSYRRVVLHVSGQPAPMPLDADPIAVYLNTPIHRLEGPPASTGPWRFYRGINLNGPPTVIDGNRWEGDGALGVQCTDDPLRVDDVRLRPETDSARAEMIRSFRWSTQVNLQVWGVPDGRYAVYVYTWEDSNPEVFSISLNDRVADRRYFSGVPGEWHRLGPWTVDVGDGRLRVTTSGGAANISGMEIWRRPGLTPEQ
jgi:hypothetical protein